MRNRSGVLIGTLLLTLNACLNPGSSVNNWSYRYTLIVNEPLERYGTDGPAGPRDIDIPIGDTLIAESESLFTGLPAYSNVLYKQRTVWVFSVLSKTTVSRKEKIVVTRSAAARSVIYRKAP